MLSSWYHAFDASFCTERLFMHMAARSITSSSLASSGVVAYGLGLHASDSKRSVSVSSRLCASLFVQKAAFCSSDWQYSSVSTGRRSATGSSLTVVKGRGFGMRTVTCLRPPRLVLLLGVVGVWFVFIVVVVGWLLRLDFSCLV